ncbi:hypothetical protein IHQ68_06320 [Chelatococcus sambhunathii]|uniref:Uncharacterized protein n=1 Tax=Chelatococcus sambhunathii TaxID=363953 RepID=A0ABU1DDU2_9HYPH|nr:hypothetical protein [Chelatococcus sambhunathii]MDR4306231.1 hypothetical protein [Chelatococcus sambhunathii]
MTVKADRVASSLCRFSTSRLAGLLKGLERCLADPRADTRRTEGKKRGLPIAAVQRIGAPAWTVGRQPHAQMLGRNAGASRQGRTPRGETLAEKLYDFKGFDGAARED